MYLIRVLMITLIAISCSWMKLSQADMFLQSHYCSKPYKPFQFNSEFEFDNFMSEVRQYKSCIDQFVEEQEKAIRNHKDAMQSAISEWNNFVNYELN